MTPGPRYHRRRQDNPLRRPPTDGRCPINRLPHELWLDVLSYLNWEELVAIRGTSKRVASLVLSPSLHHSIKVPCASSGHLPLVLTEYILPHVRHLYIADPPSRTFSWVIFGGRYARPAIRVRDSTLDLLRAVPRDHLLTLSLRTVATAEEWETIGTEIARVGGTLERLDLPHARLEYTWTEWIKDVGVRGNGLRELDLGSTGIRTLPCDLPFDNLEVLSISKCHQLPAEDLGRFLAHLPPRLQSVNLSYLNQVSLDTLYDLCVTASGPTGSTKRTALNAVHVVGIDHLTRSDVRSLQRHWFEKRAACTESRNSPPAYACVPATSSEVFPPSTSCPSLSDFLPSSPTPRTPESDSSDPMPTTPDSVLTFTLPRPSLLQIPDDASKAWEFGAMDEAMYTPPRKRCVTFPFPFLSADPKSRPKPLDTPTTDDPAGNKVRIFHSALLESDDEAGYLRFIGEVVDGTLGSDWGELTDPEYLYE